VPVDGLVLAGSAGDVLTWVVWFGAAFACVASAVAVISFSNPFYSALALIGNLASLAVMYLLLSAEFVAAAQVLVYAGAVMVMFLFVTAYLGGQADAPWAGGPSLQRIAAVAAAAALLVEVVVVISLKAGDRLSHPADVTAAFGSPADVGRLFLTDQLLAFEITSVVLLVAAVGGVVLGSHARRLQREEVEEARRGSSSSLQQPVAREPSAAGARVRSPGA
jgi:NADH:ubiquinone oxidoreductase subunit 6 (subunit J)